MKKSSDSFGRPATRGRSNPSDKAKSRATNKHSSLTSSATDEDFYSSLAQMAGDDEDDDDDSMSEVDAKNLASSLADIDDLDSDLFGNSLGRKSTPKPVAKVPQNKPKPNETSSGVQQGKTGERKPSSKDNTTSKPETKAGNPGKKFDISKYDSMDFDEDDPLAGLLSDDEDSGSKAKKTKKKQPIKKEPEIERPKTSRSRQESIKEDSPLPKTPENREDNKDKGANLSSSATKDAVLSPRGLRLSAKTKNELSFDSGDDLPGMDDSPRPQPSSVSKQSSKKASPREKTKKIDNDLFGDDDDGLLGLDEGKQSPRVAVSKQSTPSRFDELLGGKKEQNEAAKPQKPKTLDDFLSNISSSKPPSTPSASKKAPPPKDDDFLFGDYTPSAVTSPGHGRSRPDTAPGSRRTVRFADDLGLSDDLFGAEERPATAPTIRNDGLQRRRRGMDENTKQGGTSFEDDSLKKAEQEKKSSVSTNESGGGADWLGLGSDDTGLELELPTYKPPAPSRNAARRTEPNRSVSPQQPLSPTPRKQQAGSDGDDFLKMLGIATDNKPTSQKNESSLHGTERRGRRWRDKSPEKGRESPDVTSADVSRPFQGPPVEQQVTVDKETSRPFMEDLKHQQTSRLQGELKQNEDVQHQKREQTTRLQEEKNEREALEQQVNVSAKPASNIPPKHANIPTTPSQLQNTGVTPQSHKDLSAQTHSSAVVPQSHVYHSTPLSSQSNQTFEPKAQLEGEIQSLMRRLYDMESNAQKQELDSTAYVAQLETKVRRLQLENEHLQSSLEALKHRHQTETSNLETSHKAHIKTLEESYHLRESRIKEETELQATHYNDRIRALEDEKTAMKSSHARKIQAQDTSHAAEVKRIKELHYQAIEELRSENEEEIQRLRRLKEQEVSAVSSAHGHTKSLQSLMQQVLNSTKDVNDMKSHIEATHKSSLTERELVAKARDEYLTQLQDRLVKQQAENDEERTRLQGLIAKMEINIREQNRQVDQEKWRLTQDDSRIKSLQTSLEEERRITMEQLAADRANIQRARDELLREQKRVTTELQEERRSLAMERAQLSSTHREIITRQKHKSDSALQAEAELEVTSSKVKQDSAALDARQSHLKEEEGRLARDKREFEERVEKFEKEKDRIGKLSLEVQRRSEEIGELCAEGARAREEGEEALLQAQRLRQETEDERAELENRLIILREKEKQIAEDRVSIAHERRLLEMDKRNGRCRECDVKQYIDLPVMSPPPVLTTQDLNGSMPPRTPDLLLNSLELKRNFRKWDSDKEKDEEFLEQESRFLSGLRKLRVDTTPRPNPSL